MQASRAEYSAANRKGGKSGAFALKEDQQRVEIFGSTASASTSGFGFGNATQRRSLFGTTGATSKHYYFFNIIQFVGACFTL